MTHPKEAVEAVDISPQAVVTLTKEMGEYAVMLDEGLAAGTPGDAMRDAQAMILALRAALDRSDADKAAAVMEAWASGRDDAATCAYEHGGLSIRQLEAIGALTHARCAALRSRGAA